MNDNQLPAVCAAVASLREVILRRVVNIEPRAASPEAPAVVDGVISDFLFSPEYAATRAGLNYHGADRKAMTFLTLAAADALLHAVSANG